MRMCMELEKVCMRQAGGDLAVNLAQMLRAYHSQLQREEIQSANQTD